ncbi:hypothetical protein ApAK_05765 [Thermoplasmatales archaeon AK]|nr:hypothetical protein [Thermoplasmatales archaeon AK]
MKRFFVITIALVIVIAFELSIILGYHSSSGYINATDKQANESNFIVIAKLPSFEAKIVVTLYGNGFYNISEELPTNSQYVHISAAFNSSKVLSNIYVTFYSTALVKNLGSLGLDADIVQNISFFDPIVVKFLPGDQKPALTTGLFQENGIELLVISVNESSGLYYKEVSRSQSL